MNTQTYTSNPTPQNTGLSADDYTAFLAEEKLARTLANIARRAETLWDDGYKVERDTTTEAYRTFSLRTPKGDFYLVVLDSPTEPVFGDSCSCPAWEKFGECKHHLACRWLAEEGERIDAQAALMDGAECEGTGVDPYSEF